VQYLQLEKILAKIKTLSAEEKEALARDADIHNKWGKALWVPNPGPQTEAYLSEADVLLYGGAAAGGKALSIDTPIPTVAGWTSMGEVQIGDELFDEEGNPCRVVAATPIMRSRPCYRVTFSDGAEIIADGNHQWFTSTRKERDNLLRLSPEWRERRRESRPSRAKEISKKPWVSRSITKLNAEREYKYIIPELGGVRTTVEIGETLLHGNHRNHAVSVAKSLSCPNAELLIDPYIIGLWLGDGSSYKAEITSADEEIVQSMVAGGYSVNHYAKYGYGVRGGLRTALLQLGLIGNKHIPPAYLRANKDQRLALLQGLMDTDGHCDPRGQCEFTSTKRVLADGAAELIRSLGIKVSVRETVAKLNGRVIGPNYRLKFISELPVFRLARKLIRQKRSGFRGTHDRRYIVSVVPVDSVPVRCIEVSSASHLYLAGRDMIPTHNSDLGIGLAFTEHRRSLILRRRYSDIGALIERAIEINGTKNGFNGTPPPILRTANDRFIQFGANQHPGDEQSFQGRPYDLKVFDESCHFLESQIHFHLAWLRSGVPGQRCRAILASNPPVTAEGDWIVGMFRPWLDITHHNPAKNGELRWFISVDGDTNIEVEYDRLYRDENGRHCYDLPDGTVALALSRTFIPAKLSDNPFLAKTNYKAQLDSLPEPLRSAVRDGNFMLARQDAEWQVIPTQWVVAAQARWKPDGWRGADKSMSSISMDPAGGGGDSAEIMWRYDDWYSEPLSKTGDDTADGSSSAATIIKHRRHGAEVIVDVGGGYGGAVTLRLKDNDVQYIAFNGAHASSARTKDRQLRFTNKRAEAWWRFREALDPDQEGGSRIALPPSAELRADLTAPTYTVGARGIVIEDKKTIRNRIGRSTGKGDACVMCHSAGGTSVRRNMRSTANDPRARGLPKFAKRMSGPLTRKR
jgi:hypothetical protein